MIHCGRAAVGTWGDAQWGVETFTSAGGERRWETFELSQPRLVRSFNLVAIEGPDVPGYPDYPALKVGDFEVLGVSGKDPDTIVVSTSADPCFVSAGKGRQRALL